MTRWLVEDWRQGLTWASVWAAAALVFLQLLQEQVLPLIGFAIPPAWMPWVNAGVGLAIIVARFLKQSAPPQQTALDIAMRTVDEYRKWLGHEFPEVDRVLENLQAELRGEPLNAGTPGLSDNCVLSSLRDQLRRRAQARAVIAPVLLADPGGSSTAGSA